MIKKDSEENFEGYYTGSAALAPVPLHVASAIVKPEDKNQIKLTAFETMTHQANQQIAILKQQAELIMKQVREIEQRVAFSKKIYESDLRFQPVIGEVYHLYEGNRGSVLSLVGPKEWGKKKPGDYIATVKLLGDRTWEILTHAE